MTELQFRSISNRKAPTPLELEVQHQKTMKAESSLLNLSPLIIQFMRYFWVALIGLGVDFGTLIVATEWLLLPYIYSAALGFTLGLVVNFVLSERFVFKSPSIPNPIVRFALYAFIGLIGMALLLVLMWSLVELLAISYVVAKVISTIIVYMWNFLARRGMYGA